VSTLVHHLNCATMSPALKVGGLVPARIVAHCLLVEGPSGLTLVDTGFGTGDLAAPRQRLGRGFVSMMGPALDPAETAVAQVRALGHRPEDVRHVVLTHLDLDHAGGIGDFPQATVHVFADELETAMSRRSPKDRARYVPAQWAHSPRWLAHELAPAETWFGFQAVRTVADDVLLVPLRGHTRGHCGVAVRRPGGGWFLHAGDAYFSHGEKERPPTCPSGLTLFQNLVQVDHGARKDNAERLRSLHADHGDEVTVFSAHDAREYDRLSGETE
jgi:glyoxylase-like metal-dependent hydrolase (beta-lactamase superfamily II)